MCWHNMLRGPAFVVRGLPRHGEPAGRWSGRWGQGEGRGRGAITLTREDVMSKGARWIMALALVLGGMTVLPEPAHARGADCTEGFERCLNDTWDTRGLTRLAADIECTVEYLGCVRRKL